MSTEAQREKWRVYNHSPKGKQRRDAYQASPKYLERKRTYQSSPKGAATQRDYRHGRSHKHPNTEEN